MLSFGAFKGCSRPVGGGENQSDAGMDGTTVTVGPLVELPLLDPTDPGRPFNHGAGTTIAAKEGHVVVAFINIHCDGPDTFGITDAFTAVGVVTSHDHGETFGEAIVPLGDGTSYAGMPVARAAADGTLKPAFFAWVRA